MNKLMSFDVSSVSTGWSYFEDGKLIEFGKIPIPSNYDISKKLIIFQYSIIGLFKCFLPNKIVIEETYMKNVKTLKVLMQFIGVLNAECIGRMRVDPIFVSPNSVRSYFELKTKEDVFNYIKNKYKVKFKKISFEEGNDMSDSILQGLYVIEKEKEEGNA